MNRRKFLNSLSLGASAPLFSPILTRLHAANNGQVAPRVVFLIEGNGLPARHIQPIGIERAEMPNMRNPQVKQSAEEKLVDVALDSKGVELSEPLQPLERHKDRLTIVQGLSGRVCGGGHSNDYGALGAYSGRAGAKDITIDSAVAKANPAVFQHVALGISRNPKPNVIYGCSASGPNQKVPIYANPDVAYNLLFGKILGGNPEREVGVQAMLLDYMTKDVNRLAKQLPYEDSQKLKQYTDAFANISKRQAKLKDIDPGKIHSKRDKLYGSSIETERLEAHFEMAATALITGLTNTITLASGAGSPHFEVTFGGLGINVDKHKIGHGQVDGSKEMAVKIRQFHMDLLAKLVDKLEAIPEGNGSMMDNTLIVYLSDSAENHHSTCYEWPMVMLGNLGGKLKAGNRFFNVPKYGAEGHHTAANLYTTLLHAVGTPVDHFGQKDAELEGVIDQMGPISELLA